MVGTFGTGGGVYSTYEYDSPNERWCTGRSRDVAPVATQVQRQELYTRREHTAASQKSLAFTHDSDPETMAMAASRSRIAPIAAGTGPDTKSVIGSSDAILRCTRLTSPPTRVGMLLASRT